MSRRNILCVHGVGEHLPGDPAWQGGWRGPLRAKLLLPADDAADGVGFVEYFALFQDHPPDRQAYTRALRTLVGGWWSAPWRGSASAVERPGRAGWNDALKYSAGMVAQWVASDAFRAATRALLWRAIETHQPDLVLAHSLGSLIAYDAFSLRPESTPARLQALARLEFVSFGSQINHPAVKDVFGGRIQPLPARHWHHLYNRHDRVFTRPLTLAAANFTQVDATFGAWWDGDVINHDVEKYLTAAGLDLAFWPGLRQRLRGRAPGPGPASHAAQALQPEQGPEARGLAFSPPAGVSARGHVALAERPPNRRALLAGVDRYPRPQDRLAGCESDVYALSAALQESGFEAGDIRVVLNERATAEGLRDRLAWLLDDPRPGDVRFFGFSGHGARIPAYNGDEEVDALDECLLPWDFDWSRPETLLTDDWFQELYVDLPYELTFVVSLDCCHAGGMTRDGGLAARALTPPDDIRHRALRWDAATRVWRARRLPELIPAAGRRGWTADDWTGASGAARRLCRSVAYRGHADAAYDERVRQRGHQGPYLPLILQACQENQAAFEHRDGAAAHGAFTFCLARALRELAEQGSGPTFEELVARAGERLADLGYPQQPVLVGPGARKRARVPFGAPAQEIEPEKGAKKPPRRRKT